VGATYVDVTYLNYFRDLELVNDYAWGAAARAHFYKKLNKGCKYWTSQLEGYATLL